MIERNMKHSLYTPYSIYFRTAIYIYVYKYYISIIYFGFFGTFGLRLGLVEKSVPDFRGSGPEPSPGVVST